MFKGIRPKSDPELLENYEAQTAQNAYLRKGLLHPWNQTLKIDDVTGNELVRTIKFFQDTHWLEWSADVDLVEAPLAGDTAYKFYYTGDGVPKKSNLTLASTGTGAKPISFYPLAMPSPKHEATATVDPPPNGSGDDRNVNYMWTLVSNWSEESIPSPVSNTVAAKTGEAVDLTGMTHEWQAGTAYTVGEFVVPTVANDYIYKCVTAGTTDALEPIWQTDIDVDQWDNAVRWRCFPDNLSYKNIYRLNTGEEFGVYYFVAQIAVAETTYEDIIEDTALRIAIPSITWDPPPDELSGLCYMGNGIMVGFSGKDVYFSDPWHFWAFPTDYILSIPFSIIALAVLGDGVIVALTEKIPYIFTGVDPSAITHFPLPESAPCQSKRGVATTVLDEAGGRNSVAMFPGPEGIYVVNATGGTLLTKNSFDKKAWASYYPTTMHGHIHSDFYFGFYSSGGNEGCIVLDLTTLDVTTLSLYADAAYVDQKTDTLYYVKRTAEVLLQEGGTAYPSRTNAILLESGDKILLE